MTRKMIRITKKMMVGIFMASTIITAVSPTSYAEEKPAVVEEMSVVDQQEPVAEETSADTEATSAVEEENDASIEEEHVTETEAASAVEEECDDSMNEKSVESTTNMKPSSIIEEKAVVEKESPAPIKNEEVSKTAVARKKISKDPVNQYNIQVDKYYELIEHNLFDNTNNIVKVLRVFEDPKWYGSERMVEVVYCGTGKTALIRANKLFCGADFYEVYQDLVDENKIKEREEYMKNRHGLTTDDIPHYGEIKQCYFEKGANTAFWLFIAYTPSPLGYQVIEHIEKEIASGNRGYTIDGVHYDCPEKDPYFKDKHIVFGSNR